MGLVAQGGNALLEAIVRSALGSDTDADPASISLTVQNSLGADLAGFPVVEPVIIRDSLGHYHYTWAVPIGLAIGQYNAIWKCRISGGLVTRSEIWQVVAAGSLTLGPLDILIKPDDYDGIRASLGVEKVDLRDVVIELPIHAQAAENEVKGLIPDWSAILLAGGGPALALRIATSYLTAAILAEGYMKGGTISLVHKELPRRNWSEWARIFRVNYAEWLTRVMTTGTTEDIYDAPGVRIDGPSRHRSDSTRPFWLDLPPVWRYTPAP